ncbi:hypothetical protein [Pedobacter ginsengisoli]|uniref:hypothetical protein n=1 Tax=Pedobacter ginsengisoli TaxID=363852 RepID=UPI00254C08C7|nr:hypothetical protein [Pedobacter ginsengisoli]
MKKLLFLLIIGAAVAGCGTTKQTPVPKTDVIELSGKLEKLGMTTFQYGTHVLKTADKTYALKSEKVNLDGFVDKQVTLKGTKVDGYPIEAGPDLLEVQEITSK